jgi:DNA polymerase I-like protein with 3'-5' exonuclease and polymerase domains
MRPNLKEQALLKLAEKYGITDVHLARACQMTGKKPADITAEERKAAKTFNYHYLYS